MKTIEETYNELDSLLREASVAQVGGFRPPEDRITSWFGGSGVGLAGEALPVYRGRDMFCLLQVKVSELPVIPPELKQIAFLVVFTNREEFPFDKPHGDGWEIREYQSREGLQCLPESKEPDVVKSFPIKWDKVEDDAPDWENAWDLVDMTPINESDDADEKFFYEYHRYLGTKFAGFPTCIQHGHDLEGYVFQIGSEEKANWMWADNGIAYFNKNKAGDWCFKCQFY
ncbi:DUF1963 domain-containing protein [Oceanospirillum maris]|uniref:DUF1963 domain-containing protein n=1 Tax=Oceanospirillum maris TaxID=64977 RepID=UPI001B7FDCF6|nr:DUF1963 domain-containing protein [Oceanospirillum maris]